MKLFVAMLLCLPLVSCVTPGRIPAADENLPKATSLKYKDFAQSFFKLSDLGANASPVLYSGTHNGKPCTVKLSFYGSHPSAFDFDVNEKGMDVTALGGVQVQEQAGLTMEYLSSNKPHIHVIDPICGGESDIYLTTDGTLSADHITSIHNIARALKSCGGGPVFLTEDRTCENLKKQLSLSKAVLNQITQMAKDYTHEPKIKPSRFVGCGPTTNSETQVVCSWDVSDDVQGDTGKILNVYVEVKNNNPVSVSKTTTTDKYTGDEN